MLKQMFDNKCCTHRPLKDMYTLSSHQKFFQFYDRDNRQIQKRAREDER